MAETSVTPPSPPRRRRRWLKVTGWIAGVFVVLLLVVYFVGTSSAFFKGVILPRVSKSLNADVTVSDASISPFKQVVLKDLKVQCAGREPLVTASEVRARYSLFDIIRGNLHVDEVALAGPKITLVENADGTSNLDPILKSQKEKPAEAKPAKPGKASKPPQLDIRKVSLADGTIQLIKNHPGGKRDLTELSRVTLSLENLKNGQTGKLQLGADLKLDQNPPQGEAGAAQAKVAGSFDFALTPDLKPSSLKGNTHLQIAQATGAMADLATLAGDLDCEVSPTEVKQVALRFQKNNARLGEIRVSGPFDIAKVEGKLKVEVASIDRQVLNLAGAASGLDFGSTTISSTNEVQITRSGSVVSTAGRLNLNQFQVTRANQTSPPMELHADYDVTVDRGTQNAVLRTLTLAGFQRNKPVLHANLTSPMTIALAKGATNAVGDSSLNLNVTELDLADWKAFTGESAPAGIVNVTAKLLSQQGGQRLTFDVSTRIDNLTAGSGTNQISQVALGFQVQGQASDMSQFKLNEYKLQLARENKLLITVFGLGTYDKTSGAADFNIAVQSSLPDLLRALPRQDISVSAGSLAFKGHVTQTVDKQTNATRNVTGDLALTDLTGKIGKNQFRSFGLAMDMDIQANPEQALLRKISGKLTESGNPGGSFDLTGSYGMKTKAAQLTATLTDFNQAGLRAFLEPLLGDKQLASIALNGNAKTQYNPQGDSSIQANLQVTNLVVKDPQNRIPATPLEAKVQIDTSLVKQVADVRQVSLTLTPTARAKNELSLKGRVDMTDTNAYQGNLQVAADSLDVTRYYDLFGGEKKSEPAAAPDKPAARSSAPATTSSPPPAGQEKEPDAIKLPFRNFTAGVNIGKFYLREVEITNLQTSVLLDGAKVALNPFKLALNGSPIDASANLDLGMPGYGYDVSLSMNAVPLAPLVNSFQPERKGKIGGTMTAVAKIAGKGITGASLQKNLTGQFDVGSTNLNLSVDNIESRLIRTIVEVVATLPELMSNPLGAGTSLVQGLTGFKGGGLENDLRRSPIDVIVARGTAGGGKVQLSQSILQSPVFRAEASGTITLASVLTNSTLDLPVALWLERSVAERTKLLASDTAPDSKYSKLPDLLTIVGTVGDPKKKINKAALAGSGLRALESIPGVQEKTRGALGALGGLLTGQNPSGTNAPNATTNAPATNRPNRSLGSDLLNDLLNKQKKK